MDEAGNTLLEVAVAVAIVAIVAGAAGGTMANGARASAHDTIRRTLQETADRELAIARDILKYDDASIAPATIATALTLPNGSLLPAHVSIDPQPASHGSVDIAVSVVDDADASVTASATSSGGERVPLPGSQLRVRGLVPAPTGAP